MLGQLSELVRVRTIIPRGGETYERDALRRGLLGRRGEGEEGNELAHRCGGVRLRERLCRLVLRARSRRFVTGSRSLGVTLGV